MRKRHGRLADCLHMAARTVGHVGGWSKTSNLAYSGFSLAYSLGRLPEAREISERMAQEANRRQDAEALQGEPGCDPADLGTFGRSKDSVWMDSTPSWLHSMSEKLHGATATRLRSLLHASWLPTFWPSIGEIAPS